MQDSEKSYSDSHSNSDSYGDDLYAYEDISLPSNGLPFTLLIGCAGGILAALISIVTTLANASTFQEVVRLGDKISLGTAQYVTALGCLNYVVGLVIAFVAGYLVGKKAVRRLYGFYAGGLVGGISYLGNVLVQYIPNYPGHVNSSGFPLNGLLILLATTVIWIVIGALIGLWGAVTTTKKHPYYLAKLAARNNE